MGLFKRKHNGPIFYEEDPAEVRFDAMVDLVKDLSKKDYNRLKDAMDLAYKAYRKVRDIDPDDETAEGKSDDLSFALHPEEGK